MMNENQKKLQMNRGLAIALSLLVVAAIVITVIAVVSSKRAKPNPDESTTATTTQAKPAETTTGKPTEPVIAEKVSFIAPISIGNVIGEWSADIPVFSNTMEDYRVHLGVDIEADAGTPVYAAICKRIFPRALKQALPSRQAMRSATSAILRSWRSPKIRISILRSARTAFRKTQWTISLSFPWTLPQITRTEKRHI